MARCLDFFGGKSAQNMSEQQFQQQLEQSGEQFDRRMDHANYWAHRGDQWAGTQHGVNERDSQLGYGVSERDKALGHGTSERDKAYGAGISERDKSLGHGVSERDKELDYGLTRARREDFRPYAQVGVASLGKMASALGVTPEGGIAPAMGGDQHVRDWRGVDWQEGPDWQGVDWQEGPEWTGVDAPQSLGDLPKTGAGSTTGRAPHVAVRNPDGTVTLTYPDGTTRIVSPDDPALVGVKERVT